MKEKDEKEKQTILEGLQLIQKTLQTCIENLQCITNIAKQQSWSEEIMEKKEPKNYFS